MRKITNNIIIPLGLSLLVLLWCNYMNLNIYVKIALCTTVVLAALLILKKTNGRTAARISNAKIKASTQKRYSDFLLFSPSPSRIIQQCFAMSNKAGIIVSDTQLIAAEGSGNTFVLAKFCFGQLKNVDIAELSKAAQRNGCKNAVCYCLGFDSSAVVAANLSPVPITLNDLDKTIELLQLSGVELEMKQNETKQSKKIRTVLAIALHKSRSKYFFWSSIFLAINSLIVPYPIYYLISATALMTLSFYCKLNKKYNIVAKA